MRMYNKIRDEKLQYDINREAAKISALSSGKVDEHQYLAGEEILLSDQRRLNEQAKFTHLCLRKALEKQTKAIKDQVEKQIKATEEHGKQLVRSNAFAKKESLLFDKKEESIPIDEQEAIFYKLVAKELKKYRKGLILKI